LPIPGIGFPLNLFVVEFVIIMLFTVHLTARFIFGRIALARLAICGFVAPFSFSFGHRVVSCAAERIAAKYSPHGKSESDKKAPFCKSFKSIG